MSDEKAKVGKPNWFQKKGIGYVIMSYTGKVDFIAKATVDGQIRLILRGMDIRTLEDRKKRIPYWIDYTKLTINDDTLFDAVTPTWHDEPYQYTFDVKANDEVKVQVEWLPHRSDT